MKKHLISALFLLMIIAGNAQTNWTQKANVIDGIGRQGAVSFTIGNYIYVLGGSADTVSNKQLMRYDPVADLWTPMAPFPGHARVYASSFVINNKGYVGFGSGMTYNDGSYNDLYCYDPGANSWSLINFPSPPNARNCATSFSIGNKAYVVGGLDAWSSVVLNDVWEFDLTTGWIQKNAFVSSAFPLPRYLATAFVLGGTAYFGTGKNFSGEMSDFWGYDPSNDSWTQMSSFPGLPRGNDISFVIGEKGFVGAGSIGGCTFFDDFWVFAPGSSGGSWVSIDSMAVPKIGATGAACNGRGYVIAGSFSNLFPTTETWEYSPGVTTDVGMNQPVSSFDVTVFPNPSTAADQVTILLPNEGGYQVELFDSSGRRVQQMKVIQHVEIVRGDLSSGIYLCTITRLDVESKQVTVRLIFQ